MSFLACPHDYYLLEETDDELECPVCDYATENKEVEEQ